MIINLIRGSLFIRFKILTLNLTWIYDMVPILPFKLDSRILKSHIE